MLSHVLGRRHHQHPLQPRLLLFARIAREFFFVVIAFGAFTIKKIGARHGREHSFFFRFSVLEKIVICECVCVVDGISIGCAIHTPMNFGSEMCVAYWFSSTKCCHQLNDVIWRIERTKRNKQQPLSEEEKSKSGESKRIWQSGSNRRHRE